MAPSTPGSKSEAIPKDLLHLLGSRRHIQSSLHPFAEVLRIKRSSHLHVVIKVDINVARWNLPAPFPASEPAIRRIASSRQSGNKPSASRAADGTPSVI